MAAHGGVVHGWTAGPDPPADLGPEAAEEPVHARGGRDVRRTAPRHRRSAPPAVATDGSRFPGTGAPLQLPRPPAPGAARSTRSSPDRPAGARRSGRVRHPAALVTDELDLPGPVVAQVTRNVYDSATQRDVLILAGTRLVGETGIATVRTGRSAWTQMTFPTGRRSSYRPARRNLEGNAGLDRVDRHYGRVVGSALLLAAVGAGSSGGAVQPGHRVRRVAAGGGPAAGRHRARGSRPRRSARTPRPTDGPGLAGVPVLRPARPRSPVRQPYRPGRPWADSRGGVLPPVADLQPPRPRPRPSLTHAVGRAARVIGRCAAVAAWPRRGSRGRRPRPGPVVPPPVPTRSSARRSGRPARALGTLPGRSASSPSSRSRSAIVWTPPRRVLDRILSALVLKLAWLAFASSPRSACGSRHHQQAGQAVAPGVEPWRCWASASSSTSMSTRSSTAWGSWTFVLARRDGHPRRAGGLRRAHVRRDRGGRRRRHRRVVHAPRPGRSSCPPWTANLADRFVAYVNLGIRLFCCSCSSASGTTWPRRGCR